MINNPEPAFENDSAEDYPVENIGYGADLLPADDEPLKNEDLEDASPVYRATGSDPAFGFLLALAVSIGLIPLLPDSVDVRYTLAWGTLALVGVVTWLLGNNERIGQEDPIDLAWGIGLGLLLSVPFLLFFYETFGRTSDLLFPEFGAGVILAYLIFVMPLAETLFFRGLLQQQLDFYYAGALGTVWSLVLFFPVMWGEILENPAPAFFLAIALLVMNMMYSYARERNGLAAAWLTQITVSLLMLFFPGLL